MALAKPQALDASEPYDVCIVGSGPAGTVLGTTLVEQGLRVLILESGAGMRKWLLDKGVRALAEYEFSGDTDYPLTRTTSRIIGGNSNFWTGRCERFHPSDFEAHPYLPADNPWPIGYDDLEPYYTRAEQTLRVRGGEPSRYMPPRSEPYPLQTRSDISVLKDLMEQGGVTLDDSPTATPQKALRFFRVNKEILPRFLASPNGTLVSEVTATDLVHDERGAIQGVTARCLDGTTRTARARAYVVSCGGIQSPRMLLLSKSQRFPQGIGNEYDRVGRGFNEHPSLNFYGRIRSGWGKLRPRHKVGRTHQFYETCRAEGLGSIHAVCIQSFAFPNHLLRYRLKDLPGHAADAVSRLVWPTIYMSPTLEMLPHDDNRVTLSKDRMDAFGNPVAHLHLDFTDEDRRLLARSREIVLSCFDKLGVTEIEEIEQTWSRHHIGTCRMGDDPKTSVVDKNLRVHASPNLFVCGAEVFTTGAAVQPVLTITALAHRLADHVASLFRTQDPSISEASGRSAA